MDILILSCNTGGGHNSAAASIKQYFEEKGHSCTVKDALAFWSAESSKLISNGHVFIYRNFPKLFGICYRFEENRSNSKSDSLIYKMVYNGCKKLAEHLRSHTYSAVVSTHPFSAMMLTELKKKNVTVPKSYFVATDYTCSPGVEKIGLDIFFIPHEKLSDEFIKKGVPKDKLIVSGIPIKESFYNKIDPDEAKRRLKLSRDKRIVLLSCGSMGCGPIKFLAENLPARLPHDTELIVICGNNRRLYNSLSAFGFSGNVKIIGYTSRMSLYMDAASMIITKPGGLTVTEAAAKRLPMIFIDAVPGCETKNLDFFVSNGMAQSRENRTELIGLICSCLSNSSELNKISDNIRKQFDLLALETIYNTVVWGNSKIDKAKEKDPAFR